MKALTRLPLVALALAAFAAYAQGQDTWVSVSPEGERFTVKMPYRPEQGRELRLSAGELKVEGRRYEIAEADGATYLVLSLQDPDGVGERLAAAGYQSERFRRESRYLDELAELAREALARAGGEASAEVYPSLAYRREFEVSGRPAREYLARYGKVRGPVYVCADGPQIYVVAALAVEPLPAGLGQFVDSFELKIERDAHPTAEANKADAVSAAGTGIGPGRGGGISSADTGHGPFAVAEVAERARLTSRPEPLYTEEARKFQVTGRVRVRAVLAATGEVERVEVVKGLPHGLTMSAVEAARKIVFEPARRDGRPVAQFVFVEYHFNIY